MSYWDTSALAKLYVQEADSAVFESHAANHPSIVVSETGRLELRAVLRRREAEGALSPGATETLHTSFCALISSGQFREEAITPELDPSTATSWIPAWAKARRSSSARMTRSISPLPGERISRRSLARTRV